MFTNQMRFTGMSGLEVNDMVSQLMRAHSMRLDRVRQNRDVLRWQQEKHRGAAAQLRTLQSTFLDVLNPSRNLRSSSNFHARSTTVSNLDGTPANGISITTTGNTPTGHRSVQVHAVARNDVFRGSTVSNINTGITGTTSIDFSEFQPIQHDHRNMSQWATDNEMADFVRFGYFIGNNEVAAGTDGAARIAMRHALDQDGVPRYEDDGVTPIHERIAGRHVYLRGGGTAGYVDDEGFRLDAPYDDGGQRMRQQAGHNGGLNFRVTVNGVAHNIYIPASSMFETDADGNVPFNGATLLASIGTTDADRNNWLQGQINEQLSTRFGYDDGNTGNAAYQRVSVSINASGYMTVNSRQGHSVSLQNTNGRPSLGTIGFTNNQSTAVNLSNVTMAQLMGGDGEFDFTINGRNFNFDGTYFRIDGNSVSFTGDDLTLQQVLNAVNGAGTGASMSFNATTQRFTLQSNQTGAHNGVTFSSTCGFFEQIGLSSSNTAALPAGAERVSTASDAVVYVNGNRFQRTTNNFNIDGLQINLNANVLNLDLGAPPVSFNVNVERNTDHTMDLIRSFVEEYNNLIRSIRDLTHTRAPRSDAPGRRGRFLPLTDEQRRGMSDREIDLWEEQARTGILHRDSTLQSLTSRLHNEIFRDVIMPDGRELNLVHLGIRTHSDLSRFGELQIDEDRLMRWLDERPEDVAHIFTAQDDRLAGTNNMQNRRPRLQNSGIASRINDIITWELSRNGGLFEHAGIAGTMSDSENRLSNRIQQYDQRAERMRADLARREQRYFVKFSRLESALMAGQNQMMFLEQMMWAGN